MLSDRWREVKPIFERAVVLEGEAREAWIRLACDGDPELLAAVSSMLAADQSCDPLLDRDFGDV